MRAGSRRPQMQASSSWNSPLCRGAAKLVHAPRWLVSLDRAGDPIAGQPRLPRRLRHVLTRGRGEEVQARLVLEQVRRAEIADGTSARSERFGGSSCTPGGLFQRGLRTAGQVELEAVIRHRVSIAPPPSGPKAGNPDTLRRSRRDRRRYLSERIASRSASRLASSVRDRTPSFAYARVSAFSTVCTVM